MPHHHSAEEPAPDHQRLLAHLDPDPRCADEEYVRLYQRLLRFFEWRGCYHPEEAADSTIDRVIRKLAEGTVDSNIHAFVTGVARFVCFEFLRAQERFLPLPEKELSSPATARDDDQEALACLERCMTKLPPENQTLIRDYYESKDRKAVAKALGVNLNVLRLRASRIRDKLERCIMFCLRSSEA
jgi:DNA-directed RNA polymerase specialized sigma24 family protein